MLNFKKQKFTGRQKKSVKCKTLQIQVVFPQHSCSKNTLKNKNTVFSIFSSIDRNVNKYLFKI